MEALEIRELRERLGISQRELGSMVGATKTSVFKWESKRSKPHRMFLSKLEELLKGNPKKE